MIDWDKLVTTFEKKGFSVRVFSDISQAKEYLCTNLRGKSVGFGGSMTIKEMGLYESLRSIADVHWHWVDNTRETREKAYLSDVYILSANGVSESGEIINIDGAGNRVSASLYGPRKVVYVIGRNKIAPDFDKALWRARNIAAVKNAARVGADTPCVKAGCTKCFDCKSPNRVCNGFVTVTRPMMGQSVEIIFIDQELGY